MLPIYYQNHAHLREEMEQYMADIVKVTTPTTGYENTTPRQNPITPGDTQIQNVADPTRINRPDGKTEQKGADNRMIRALSLPRKRKEAGTIRPSLHKTGY